MTTFLSGPGFGAPQSGSVETQALQQINSRTKTFANKDFVKNMAWLNQSVDTLSAYTQKLQKGVDSANQNAFEQVQGIWADLFVLFGGLEPTGIEIGDVKYIIQGLGALLGINPETPFPLNLVEAAWHMFETYIIPADQFTDVIFDAIEAWAVEFGLSPDFLESLGELRSSIEAVTDSFDDFFASISSLLTAFGFMNFNELGEFLAAMVNLFDLIALEPLKPVLSALADLGIPFIEALTAIVNAGNAFLTPFSLISGSQVVTLGENIVPKPSDNTTLWNIGATGAEATAWVFDDTQSASGTDGSFTTLGNGTAKRALTQQYFPVTPGKKIVTSAQLRWAGIPTGSNDFGYQMTWYFGGTEISVTNVNVPTGHGATGGWAAQSPIETTVPIDVDSVRFGPRIGTGITTGQVWVDDITGQKQGGITTSIIDGLDDLLGGFLPIEFFDDIIGIPGATPEDLATWFSGLLPADFFDNLGIDPGGLLDFEGAFDIFSLIPIGNLGNQTQNLLFNPNFLSPDALEGEGIWNLDTTLTHLGSNNVWVTANSVARELESNRIRVSLDQVIDLSAYAKWESLAGSGTPIRLLVNKFHLEDDESWSEVGTSEIVASLPFSANGGFSQLVGSYEVIDPNIDAISLIFYVDSTATAGTVRFAKAFAGKSQLLPIPWVKDLPLNLGSLEDFTQSVIDTFIEATTGIPVVGGLITDFFNEVEDLFNTTQLTAGGLDDLTLNLLDFPDTVIGMLSFLNVSGALGPIDIGSTAQAILDQFISGFVNVIGTGSALADAFNTANIIGSNSFLGKVAYDITQLFNNKPFNSGMNPTAVSTIGFDTIATAATLPTTSVTQSNTIAGLHLFEEATSINFVTWLGFGIAGLTGLYVDIWRFKSATSTFEWVCSVNGLSVAGPTMQYNTVQLPFQVDAAAGETLMAEIVPVGGTHTVVAVTGAVPNRNDMVPKNMAVRKNMGSSLVQPRNPFADYQDPFNSIDTDIWTPYSSGASPSISSGRVSIPNANAGIVFNAFSNMNGKQAWIEVPQVITGAAATQFEIFEDGSSPRDFMRIYQNGGNIFFDVEVASVVNQTSAAYNATNDRWWRLNFEDSTNIIFETSANGYDWLPRRTVAKPAAFDMTKMKVNLFGGSGGSGNALFDNFNMLPGANLNYVSTFPYIELAKEGTQSTGIPYHSPVLTSYDFSTTYIVESWVNTIEPVALGGAGGGFHGAFGFSGEGGLGGNFSPYTVWTKGVHFNTGSTVTITRGAGGPNGVNGSSTTISVNGNTVTGTGGQAGDQSATTAAMVPGKSPGSVTYNGQPYVGGVQQNSSGAAGNAPGGGGAGGAQPTGNGGPGAIGRAWLKKIQ